MSFGPVPETVTRPDPGLARGVWEASPLTLYIAAAIVVLLALGYFAFRLRIFKRRVDVPPISRRSYPPPRSGRSSYPPRSSRGA